MPGAIKRYGFHSPEGYPRYRPGAPPCRFHAAPAPTPSRVCKGKKLPGHMGAERVTVQNLDVVKVDAENNLIALKGAIPGPKGGIVLHHRQRQEA